MRTFSVASRFWSFSLALGKEGGGTFSLAMGKGGFETYLQHSDPLLGNIILSGRDRNVFFLNEVIKYSTFR